MITYQDNSCSQRACNSKSVSISWRYRVRRFLRNNALGACPSLTHWGRVTHICVSKLTIIGSDNGLSPGRRQAIIWTNAGRLWIRTVGTNLSEIHTFSLKKNAFENVVWEMAAILSRPQCVNIYTIAIGFVCFVLSRLYYINSPFETPVIYLPMWFRVAPLAAREQNLNNVDITRRTLRNCNKITNHD